MTHQEFREQDVTLRNKLSALITEHFDALCIVAKEAHEPFRIHTPYGEYDFQPSNKIFERLQ